MSILGITIAATIAAQVPTPSLWLTPKGQVLIEGKQYKARLIQPARLVNLGEIYAWDFNNGRGAMQLGDLKELQITGSMTVSVWLKLRSYVNDGPGAQILFRGDDRNGLDPYDLVVHSDGTINFSVQNEESFGRHVTAEVPLQKWFHILANFDAETGTMEMWHDGILVAGGSTARRPFAFLDRAFAPGVSIGNVQNDLSPHNQPLNGYVADLRLYRGVVRPKDLDLGRGGWTEPPK